MQGASGLQPPPRLGSQIRTGPRECHGLLTRWASAGVSPDTKTGSCSEFSNQNKSHWENQSHTLWDTSRYNNTTCQTIARDSKISGNDMPQPGNGKKVTICQYAADQAELGNPPLKLRNMGQCKSSACGQATLQYISKYEQGIDAADTACPRLKRWNKLGTTHTIELGTCTTGQWCIAMLLRAWVCLMPQICAEPETPRRCHRRKHQETLQTLAILNT